MNLQPQDLDRVFHEFCRDAPDEMLDAFEGAGAEFWHEPSDRQAHWSFGAVCGIKRQEGAVIVGVLTPPDYPNRVIEVPIGLVRLTQDIHPTLRRHLVAVRVAQVARMHGHAAQQVAVAEVKQASEAWCDAFDRGLPGVRPAVAKVRPVDIPNLEYFGLFAGDSVPGEGGMELGG